MPDVIDVPALEHEIVPGEDGNSHYQVRIAGSNISPEMQHCLLWIRLRSHSTDGGLGLNNPPHLPLETAGRIWFVSPLIGTTRGK